MKATISVAGVELPDGESCGRFQDRHVLTQPTVLRPQPADVLVLLGYPGRLAAVTLGLGDPAPQRLLPTPTCLDTVSTAAALGRVLDTVLQHQLSLDQSVALRSSAVRPGEDFAGIFGPETKERFGLLLGGTLTGWASWRWVMYVNAAFAAHPDRCLAAAGQARDHLV